MKKDKRFEIVSEEVIKMREATVLRDKQTGILYLFVLAGNGGGLTPLLDKEGKPIVEEGI